QQAWWSLALRRPCCCCPNPPPGRLAWSCLLFAHGAGRVGGCVCLFAFLSRVRLIRAQYYKQRRQWQRRPKFLQSRAGDGCLKTKSPREIVRCPPGTCRVVRGGRPLAGFSRSSGMYFVSQLVLHV
ncbi:unnamed protein product, partial [Ectocarpus sp. 12 AP-2014]